MKRTIAVVAVILALVACATFLTPNKPGLPGTVTLVAQSLPIQRTVVWDANPVGDAVINYVVRLDGAVVGSPTAASQPITITALGAHTISVVAVNSWSESTPATLAINVVGPGKPTGLRIQ